MCVRRLLLRQARSRALEGRFSSHPRCSRRTFASREFTSSSSACSPASIATISAAITAAAVCHAPTTTHPLATTQGQVLAALAAFNCKLTGHDMETEKVNVSTALHVA